MRRLKAVLSDLCYSVIAHQFCSSLTSKHSARCPFMYICKTSRGRNDHCVISVWQTDSLIQRRLTSHDSCKPSVKSNGCIGSIN